MGASAAHALVGIGAGGTAEGSPWQKRGIGQMFHKQFGAYRIEDVSLAFSQSLRMKRGPRECITYSQLQWLLPLDDCSLLLIWDALCQNSEALELRSLLTTVCIFSSSSFADKARFLLSLCDASRSGVNTLEEVASALAAVLKVLSICTSTAVKPRAVAAAVHRELPALLPRPPDAPAPGGEPGRRTITVAALEERALPLLEAAYRRLPLACPPPPGARPPPRRRAAQAAAAAPPSRLVRRAGSQRCAAAAGGGATAAKALGQRAAPALNGVGWAPGWSAAAPRERAREPPSRERAWMVLHGQECAEFGLDGASFRLLFARSVSQALGVPGGHVEVVDVRARGAPAAGSEVEFLLRRGTAGGPAGGGALGAGRSARELLADLDAQLRCHASPLRRGPLAAAAAGAELLAVSAAGGGREAAERLVPPLRLPLVREAAAACAGWDAAREEVSRRLDAARQREARAQAARAAALEQLRSRDAEASELRLAIAARARSAAAAAALAELAKAYARARSAAAAAKLAERPEAGARARSDAAAAQLAELAEAEVGAIFAEVEGRLAIAAPARVGAPAPPPGAPPGMPSAEAAGGLTSRPPCTAEAELAPRPAVAYLGMLYAGVSRAVAEREARVPEEERRLAQEAMAAIAAAGRAYLGLLRGGGAGPALEAEEAAQAPRERGLAQAAGAAERQLAAEARADIRRSAAAARAYLRLLRAEGAGGAPAGEDAQNTGERLLAEALAVEVTLAAEAAEGAPPEGGLAEEARAAIHRAAFAARAYLRLVRAGEGGAPAAEEGEEEEEEGEAEEEDEAESPEEPALAEVPGIGERASTAEPARLVEERWLAGEARAARRALEAMAGCPDVDIRLAFFGTLVAYPEAWHAEESEVAEATPPLTSRSAEGHGSHEAALAEAVAGIYVAKLVAVASSGAAEAAGAASDSGDEWAGAAEAARLATQGAAAGAAGSGPGAEELAAAAAREAAGASGQRPAPAAGACPRLRRAGAACAPQAAEAPVAVEGAAEAGRQLAEEAPAARKGPRGAQEFGLALFGAPVDPTRAWRSEGASGSSAFRAAPPLSSRSAAGHPPRRPRAPERSERQRATWPAHAAATARSVASIYVARLVAVASCRAADDACAVSVSSDGDSPRGGAAPGSPASAGPPARARRRPSQGGAALLGARGQR